MRWLFGLVAAFLCTSVLASESESYDDAGVHVTITTSSVPSDFLNGPKGPDSRFFGVTTLITRIAVTVDNSDVYLPTRAFDGLYDPHSVEIRRIGKSKDWMLRIIGGDASTSYRTEIRFKKDGSLEVREFDLESDEKIPYVVERFRRPIPME
jgi:hypothetical protein